MWWCPTRSPKCLSGGKTDMTEIVNEDHVTKLERAAFMKLVKTEAAPWRAWNTC